ncbi:hypothetical protein SAMN02799624_05303 [Paenibacillus sp. UNC496MF]|uniref:hypothetical protein n=1 Tax=Paenibacillus sp. UNC496MF TaxID=1502753 RepID=UPI0008ED3353|nr:hypothetical protein [Paenibacillus sp. UNC496MF]SFJ63819.1 hypothetical protein SAMN02799624_05303 [Paenibacillus sp. UNC496MF]
MSYYRESERQRAYELVGQSIGMESDISKQEKVQRAIEFAKDELVELDQELQKFMEKVRHLHVFDALIRHPFEAHVDSLKQQAIYLLEKDYTQEELDQMPEHVFDTVVVVQKKRVEVLKAIARTYLNQ